MKNVTKRRSVKYWTSPRWDWVMPLFLTQSESYMKQLDNWTAQDCPEFSFWKITNAERLNSMTNIK